MPSREVPNENHRTHAPEARDSSGRTHWMVLVGAAAVALATSLIAPPGAQAAPLALLWVPVLVVLLQLCVDWRAALLALSVTIGVLAALTIAGPAALAAVAASSILLIAALEWRSRQSVLRLFDALAQSRGRREALWIVDQLGRVIAANDRAWKLDEDRVRGPLTGSDLTAAREATVPDGELAGAPNRPGASISPDREMRAVNDVELAAASSLEPPAEPTTAAGERSPIAADIEQLRVQTSRLESELQKSLSDRATLVHKMHGKEELLSLVSHDLRSALNAMVGWLYLARSPNASTEGRDRALEGIASAVSTQRRLVEQLLDASRLLSGKRLPEVSPVDSGALLSRIAARFETRAHDRSLDFSVESTAGTPVFNADPGRVEESLATLVELAMSIAPDKGCIRVRASEGAVEGQRWARIEVEAPGARLAAADLDNALAGAISDRATESGRRSSLGLPMAIARTVTELQGGRLRLQSMPSEAGTRMLLSFPLSARAAATGTLRTDTNTPGEEAAQAQAHAEAQGQPGTRLIGHDLQPDEADAEANAMLAGAFILLVDDMDDMLDVTAALLRGYGAHVTIAHSAAQGLARYPTWAAGGGERIVISDLSMPGRDGLDLIRDIRSFQAEHRMPRIPAVAFSAQSDLYSGRSVIEAGFDLYLAKPISPQHLVSAISALIGR